MKQIVLTIISLFLLSFSAKSQLNEPTLIEDDFLLYEEAWNNECLKRSWEEELSKSHSLKNDTMSILKLQFFWQYFKNDYNEEFVISSTKCFSGLNYGIHWSSGEIVMLPKSYYGNVFLDKIDNNLSIIWSIKKEGKIEVHCIHLQDLKIKKDKLPKRVKITSY
jgi:hypothetical protein